MEKNYDPGKVESAIYRRWLDAGVFHPDPAGAYSIYSIVIPPPNVTDRLHLGHALNNTLQDILIRWRRMTGCVTLWMPGTDHAGIATQTVVEKRILAEEGKRRTDFQRDQFVARIQAWKDEYEQTILGQLRAMGCSCDWQRTRFTMDEVCAPAVREAFFRLFADGLIYRGKRLVNWDPATQTVLADDEVEHETVQGHFWYLQYPLAEAVQIGGKKIEHVTVATTRPETMLGDTAVAINPADPRAKHLVGKKVRLPIVGRIIPIIADDSVVLPDADSEDEKARFSTGFLKVTPAHDPTDWEIGQRNGLEIVNVLAPDGTISDRHGWLDATAPEAQNLLGMDRFEAREAIVEWFRTEGMLEDVREYVHEVGHSYRSHVPIEPYLSDQWFIAVKQQLPKLPDEGLIDGTDVPVNSLAGLALKPLLDGELKFTPDRYAAPYRAWLTNLRDWPISRQLWWGHRIPVWTVLVSHAAQIPRAGGSLDPRPQINEAKGRLEKYLKSCGLDKDPCVRQSEQPVEGDFPLYVCCRTEDAHQALSYIHTMLSRRATADSALVRTSAAEKNDFEQKFGKQASRQATNLRGTITSCQLDPDVLDTWFSSALWPISTMGWPEETELLKAFYPTSVLCTAREIITLWVSRMVMFGQYFRGQIPFRDVYIHAMIQDGQGRKMSKSLGNGIDPLDIIASHGADAMRFTLAYMTTQTQDVRMPVEEMTLSDGRRANTSPKFDIGRNFCNKLWNASRFALMNLEATPPWTQVSPSASLPDAWILSRLNETVRQVTESLSAYRFHEAMAALYRYMWNDFCDWYLEIAKVRINAGETAPKTVLAHALDVLLRLLHPFVPFITEQIWSQLNSAVPHRGPGEAPAEPMLVAAAWPRAESTWINPALERRFAAIQQLISGIREVRSRQNIPPAKKLRVTVAAGEDEARQITENAATIAALAGVAELGLDPAAAAAATDATVLAGGLRALVHHVIDRQGEQARLAKQAETLRRGIAGIEAKLGNENFLARAPADVVESQRRRLAQLKTELAAVEKSLQALG